MKIKEINERQQLKNLKRALSECEPGLRIIQDIKVDPDPPDFALTTSEGKVGLEVTCVTPEESRRIDKELPDSFIQTGGIMHRYKSERRKNEVLKKEATNIDEPPVSLLQDFHSNRLEFLKNTVARKAGALETEKWRPFEKRWLYVEDCEWTIDSIFEPELRRLSQKELGSLCKMFDRAFLNLGNCFVGFKFGTLTGFWRLSYQW